MNERDKNNLQFILSLNEQEVKDWYECLDDDDIAYAMELIQTARTEINMRLVELYDDIEDVSTATSVLKKFTLKV